MIRRMHATLHREALVQFRHGFYIVGALLTVIWLVLFSVAPDFPPALIWPAFLFINLLVTTFYFGAGLVLLERAEGSLAGLVVSPLREGEYLWAKSLSLTALACLESLVVLFAVHGFAVSLLPLAAGLLGLGALYTFCGLIAVARHHTINGFLLPSVAWVLFLLLPLLDHAGIGSGPIWYLHPLKPALVLLLAGFTGAETADLAIAVATLLIWLTIAYAAARRAFRRYLRVI